MESDLGNTGPFKYPLQHIVDAVRRDGTVVRGGEHIGVIGFLFLFFQNFYVCHWHRKMQASRFVPAPGYISGVSVNLLRGE